MSAKRNSECKIILEKILSDFPDYLPIYYQAAAFFAQNDDFEKTKKIYETGILLAQKKGEIKTMKELQSAFESFIFENE
jgi:exopolysaccharide biosynthesis predicted pyruvyltransferase EpsI